MMPQFLERDRFRFQLNDFSIGLTIFLLGLFKKVIIADEVAGYASAAFTGAENGFTLTFFEAWTASLSYTMQLYFDFSAYSDMAIGLGRMFGIRLPMNFNSPYKATCIIDFWRRWHMTLSRFLRDYLYIPLGGSRQGPTRRQVNLMLTMLLGGMWHGAGWTFIAWGGLHGLYLMVNHKWRASRKSNRETRPVGRLMTIAYWALTLLAVMVSWIFFRAVSFDGALAILSGMFGLNGMSLPGGLASSLGSLTTLTGGWIDFEGIQVNAFPLGVTAAAWALGASLIAFLAPNVCEIMHRFEPAIETYPGELKSCGKPWMAWQPNRRWAAIIALMGFWTLANLTRVSEFLYFQF
jgi:alginate O-acetyltransferase complex protein AlgI